MANDKNKKAELKEEAKLTSRMQETPIAIVGMAALFADAPNLEKYWDNIVERVDSIIDVPPSRWAIDDYYSANKNDPDKSYCKRGGFIPDIDFDPMEFGLPPNILEVTDVAQLLTLVVAREVLEDAGIGEASGYNRDRVGITLGVGGGQKLITPLTSRLQYPVLDKVLKSSGVSDADRAIIIDKFKKAYVPWEENSFPGMLGNVIAGRVANRFDLGGTNCVVDAACAGSLAAIKLAVSDLLERRADYMITGGVCADNSPFMYMSFSKTPAFTTNDTIRPFDHESKGMMVGEGIGLVALKRLEDAERDNDRIYAVLRGIGTSSDGRFKSIYAPRPEGQMKALRRAYEDAGFDPSTVGMIEAHGTGTAAGDAAEFSALNAFFSEANTPKNQIALGSVKSQVGHTKSAAGAAGIIKAALALHHKVLPATINVTKPNPILGVEDSPFHINTETRPWMPRADGVLRRAGISSFGFGGTNFHFVLEEKSATPIDHFRISTNGKAIVLEANNVTALAAEVAQWQGKLSAVDADQAAAAFGELAKNHGLRAIAKHHARVGFVAKNAQDAAQLLDAAAKQLQAKADAEQWSLPSGVTFRREGIDTNGKIAALFSGQGSQYVNMAREVTYNFPPMMQTIAQMDQLFVKDGKKPLSSLIFPNPVFDKADAEAQEKHLQLTQHAQPSIGIVGVGFYKLLQQAGFKADFAAGHSFGELTALWAGGVLPDEDYLMLAKARGQAMAAPDDANFDAGTMIAVVGDVDKVAGDIKGFENVSIANYNSKDQVVVAGATEQVNKAFDALKQKGYKVVKLPVSAAFHTPLVGHAQKPFADAIEKAKFNKPTIPVFANGTGQAHSDKPADIKKVMKNHILESVRFKDEVENMYAAGGRVFVEFGPKNVLTKLVDNILADKSDVVTVALNANPKKDSDAQLRNAAVQLAVIGVQLADIDPYAYVKPARAAKKKSPMTIKLNAGAYVSDKTRKAFTDALADGHRIKGEAKVEVVEKVVEKIVEKVVEKIVEVPVAGSAPAAAAPVAAGVTVDAGSVLDSIEKTLTQFVGYQRETAAVHEKYLETPKVYSETFLNLMQQQMALAAQGMAQIPDSIDRSMTMFHQLQAETLRAHEHYLATQASSVNTALGMVQNQYAGLASGAPVQNLAPVGRTQAAAPVQSVPVTPAISTPVVSPAATPVAAPTQAPVAAAAYAAPAAAAKAAPAPVTPQPAAAPSGAKDVLPLQSAPAAGGIDVVAIQKVMLDVVAEKTGYPAEMLELSMDMEADLGIDSIKRVEILGSVQEQLPGLPELNPEDLAELRTLGQIVDYMKSKAPAGVAAAAPVASAAVGVAPATAGVDVAAIQKVMMDVVAEKTGYPAEMLELSMDMEADLGIDSIKRVEILGSVQEQLPGLPELNPEDLAELRTLGQIVDYMKSKAPAGVAAAPVAATAAPAAGGVDVAAIQKVMMSVVAEKTGYPAEMLELSMDMEADLGIDSIKRVEILGAVQEELPGLPELNPEDLAELRTLGQIVDYMKSKAPAGSSAAFVAAPAAALVSAAPAATGGMDVGAIQKVMMTVVAEKTGYPAEMLELSMDMEADLGIDSIKRVEILGAVQEELPGLPELNPEDLAELRTLGQIVDYMKSKAPAATASAAPVVLAATGASGGVDVAAIQKVMMTVVAEKTGYPSDMLELSMDMEADLGIDSIKRVEILGAVQEELPGLPELNPEDLAELRTLGQIVDYMKSKAGSAAPAASAPVAAAAPAASAASASVNVSDLQPIVLAIVGEKTGYPVEMLELDMDMEADLGIDSIKRVEILSAVQERVPGLPEFNPDVLAEFRTLQQIVDAMSNTAATAGATATAAPAASAAAAVKSAPKFEPAPSATVVVKKLPQPDQISVALPKASLCLVNDDGSAAVTPLISQLQKQGWEVAVLQWPLALSPRTAKLPSNVKAVNVAEATEAGLQAAIETVTQTIGNIAALIHLQPARSINGIEYPDAARDLLRLVFLQAKHLKVALNEAAASGGRAAFITVSRIDGQLGWKGGNSDLLQAGLFGLTKTLFHEWPSVFCRAVDADPAFDGEALAKAIVAELWDADRRISEVGISANDRVTLIAQETDSYAQAPGKSISKDSVFLVSGGAKGVTTACVAALAKNFGGKYILMGRSELLAAEPTWSAGVTNEAELKKRAMAELTAKGDKPTPVKVQQFLRPILSSREISQALQDIRNAGGEAEYVAGDVTDAAGIKAKLATVQAKLGKITGIVHGAGVLADRLIEQKTVKDFDAVYGTKINGLAAMLACVDVNAITHFVMFSSAAGFYGNVGQSDYAIANDILNKTAIRFKQLHPAAQCLAFDWGPWDGGMVTPELKRMFTERGVYIIPLEAGAQLFASEVGAAANRCPQIVVGNEMQGAGTEGTPAKKLQASRLARVVARAANPFVEHHVIGGNAVVPTVAMTGWMAAGCEMLFAGFKYAGMRNYRLFKGIVFDGSEPSVVYLDANPGELQNGELVVKVQVYSDAKGKRVNHYGADVVLMRSLPAAPVYANAPAVVGASLRANEKPTDAYRDGTLFHGALLQGITSELSFSEKQLVLGCTMTNPNLEQQGQFHIGTTNLFADDLLFQAMLVWARKQYGAGSLPSSVTAIEQFRVAQPGEHAFIVVDVIRHNEKALQADVTMLTADGAIISRFKGAEVTISPSLNALFKPATNK